MIKTHAFCQKNFCNLADIDPQFAGIGCERQFAICRNILLIYELCFVKKNDESAICGAYLYSTT